LILKFVLSLCDVARSKIPERVLGIRPSGRIPTLWMQKKVSVGVLCTLGVSVGLNWLYATGGTGMCVMISFPSLKYCAARSDADGRLIAQYRAIRFVSRVLGTGILKSAQLL
jgi:hypothetical protein